MHKLSPQTLAIHSGTKRSQFNEMSEAIFLTQSFKYETAEQAEDLFLNPKEGKFGYSRYENPTVRMFEERIAAIDKTEDAYATATGMAAVHGALFSILKSGDHLVASRALFGSCLYIIEELLPRFGVKITFVNGTDLDDWESAITTNTKVVFLETISNPTLEIIDLAAVSKIAHRKGALVVVDNVFTTPVFSLASSLGADVIIYSATKHIDGQGRCLGGIICGSKEFIKDLILPFMKHTGGSLSPFNAWIMLKSLETINIRCQAQAESSLKIAKTLEKHPKIQKITYPYLKSYPQYLLAKKQMTRGGTVIAIELLGDKQTAFSFINNLKIISISNNLGDSRSMITHPATTTHQRLSVEQKQHLGITDGLVRLSVGLEDVKDLMVDIRRSLATL
ncbi:MAG: O-succinylhomoserine sulfhydrylase [Proteobacteria bacterium]|nr:O-succinylhomoserine sulfhydrylase [Pseudomonadota bacterium]MDA1238766.1 O-succinylhomoserine sulfhydrylase [Pseudomonadota bacterium]